MELRLRNIPPTACNNEIGSLVHKALTDQAQAVTSSLQLKLSKDARQSSKRDLKTERQAHSRPEKITTHLIPLWEPYCFTWRDICTKSLEAPLSLNHLQP
eukprot:scaffold112204_cov21-Prasinocladus_malaysianus.AAC.3